MLFKVELSEWEGGTCERLAAGRQVGGGGDGAGETVSRRRFEECMQGMFSATTSHERFHFFGVKRANTEISADSEGARNVSW